MQLPEKECKQSKPYNVLRCQPLELLEGLQGPIQSTMRGRKREDTLSSPLRQTEIQMIKRLRCFCWGFFLGQGGLLIQGKYLTKKSVSVSARLSS